MKIKVRKQITCLLLPGYKQLLNTVLCLGGGGEKFPIALPPILNKSFGKSMFQGINAQAVFIYHVAQ